MHKLYICLATGFYSGYSRIAPGTCGTIVAAILSWFCFYTLKINPGLNPGMIAFTILFVGFAIKISDVVQQQGLLGKEKDPQRVVIDEFAGYLVTVVVAGVGADSWGFILCFILFRAFDMLKPPPIKMVERLSGGWGIVLDDVLAGLYAACCVRLILLST